MRQDPFDRALLAFLLVGGLALVWFGLVAGPSFVGVVGFPAPYAWHLFYFHVPVAMMTFVAFGLACYHSLHFLARGEARRDRAAQSAVETGAVFAAITIATGALWARAEWGPLRAWWDDAKLVTEFITLLVYLAYLLLRREVGDPDRRARVAAVYACAAVVTVPLTWFAEQFRATFAPRTDVSVHPELFGADAPDAGVSTPGVLPIFFLGLFVFLAALLYLHRWRQEVLRLNALADEMETAVPA